MLVADSFNPRASEDSKKSGRKGAKTDAVRVCSGDAPSLSAGLDRGDELESDAEEDEMIWWRWEGVLEGFSDF